MYQKDCLTIIKCSSTGLRLAAGHLLVEPNVPIPEEPEPSVCYLDAPEAGLLQLLAHSGELVPQAFVSENQSDGGSDTPDIRRGGISEFLIQGPLDLECK